MNVGLSTSVIQRGKSGVARYVLSLVESFLPYSGEHRFILFVLEDDLPLFAFAEPQMTLVAVPERYRSPVRDILWHQIILPRLAHKYKLDVLHIPSYRRMLYRAPCPIVSTIHDLAPFQVAGKYSRARMLYGRNVIRRLARKQKQVITVSRATACDLSHYCGLPKERITVIHNGINHERFNPGDRVAAKSWVAEKHAIDESFFLYVARLEHPAKNHARLVDAFNRFKSGTGSPWKLVLGGSDWHGAEIIHQCIEASPYRNDIYKLGFVGDLDLPNWYRAADVFVFPSLFEGFGLPPLEAMACGCPVLSSTRGALAEAIGEAAATVDPENVEDLQEQMTRLAEDTNLQITLRQSGLKHAKRFTWAKAAEATLRVYEDVLAEREFVRLCYN